MAKEPETQEVSWRGRGFLQLKCALNTVSWSHEWWHHWARPVAASTSQQPWPRAGPGALSLHGASEEPVRRD